MVVAPPLMTRRAAALVAVASVVVLAIGIWTLRTFDPNTAGSLFPPCLFFTLTGLYCPGCGLTRALHALVHFDLPRALAMNSLIVLSMPLWALMAVHGGGGRPRLPVSAARIVFDGRYWIAALLLFGVARNLPWWPFVWLAPG
ncbi:MAG TPA: DUF2752 domain-containing protein [Lysobacter sp.]|nr:DUF2752 domain-containing protein [Lysobacter sp.]